LLGLLTLSLSDSFAAVHEYETTHLKTKAGTGVASILAEESAFLNPASLSFYDSFSVHAQRDSIKVKDTEGNVIQKPNSMGFVIADGNPGLSGTISYVDQDEQDFERKRWGFSMSSLIGEKSAFGTSIRKTKDKTKSTNTEVDYYQTVFGVTHVLDEGTSLGLVAYDVFDSKADETKGMLGLQHVFLEYITISGDAGADFTADEITDTVFYRGALQVRVLNDFFLRFGASRDKLKEEKANGMGLSWVTPRLAIEFALKETTQLKSTRFNRDETKLKETSIGLSMRF
jgi:hypothetical protein